MARPDAGPRVSWYRKLTRTASKHSKDDTANSSEPASSPLRAQPVITDEPAAISKPASISKSASISKPTASGEPATSNGLEILGEPAVVEEPEAIGEQPVIDGPAIANGAAAAEVAAIADKPAAVEEPADVIKQAEPTVGEPAVSDEPAAGDKPTVIDEPTTSTESTVAKEAADDAKPAAIDEPSIGDEPSVPEAPTALEKPTVTDEPLGADTKEPKASQTATTEPLVEEPASEVAPEPSEVPPATEPNQEPSSIEPPTKSPARSPADPILPSVVAATASTDPIVHELPSDLPVPTTLGEAITEPIVLDETTPEPHTDEPTPKPESAQEVKSEYRPGTAAETSTDALPSGHVETQAGQPEENPEDVALQSPDDAVHARVSNAEAGETEAEAHSPIQAAAITSDSELLHDAKPLEQQQVGLDQDSPASPVLEPSGGDPISLPELDDYHIVSPSDYTDENDLTGAGVERNNGDDEGTEVIVRYYGRRPSPGTGAHGVADELNRRAQLFSGRWRFSPLPEEHFLESDRIYLIDISCRFLGGSVSAARFDDEVRDLKAWLGELADHDGWYPASHRPLAWMIKAGIDRPPSVYALSLLAGADVGDIPGREFAMVGGDLAESKAISTVTIHSLDQAKTVVSSSFRKHEKALATLTKLSNATSTDYSTSKMEDNLELVMAYATIRRSEDEFKSVLDQLRRLNKESREVSNQAPRQITFKDWIWSWFQHSPPKPPPRDPHQSVEVNFEAAKSATDGMAGLLAFSLLEAPCKDGNNEGQIKSLRLTDCLSPQDKERLYEQLGVQADLLDNEAYVAGQAQTQIKKVCKMHDDWLSSTKGLLQAVEGA